MPMLLDKSATLNQENALERSMDCDRAWVWVQRQLAELGRPAEDLTLQVFRRAWIDQTYEFMAKEVGYSADHLRSIGAELFRSIGDRLGHTVNKSNFKTVLTQHLPPEATENRASRFLGRDIEVAALNEFSDQGAKIIVLQGLGGIGKTTLARKYFETQGYELLGIWMLVEGQATSPEFVLEDWLRGFNLEAGPDFGVNLTRLRSYLKRRSTPVGILLDNLETVLDGNGRFLKEYRRYVDLLRVLADPDLATLTLITSREDLSEAQLESEVYRIGGLAQTVWRDYFDRYQIQCTEQTLGQLWQATNGNPKAMKILTGAARSDHDRNLDAYWQNCNQDILMEGELQALVEQQFDRLAQTQPDAYRLLCRLGVYRYQEVPNVPPSAVLSLLWELPEGQHRLRVLTALKDRSLIDSRRNEIFWLHPMIRTEAIKRLGKLGEWEALNRRAGIFWQTSVARVDTVEDAPKAMEAYYHFLAICDYNQACEVILALKETTQGERIPLGWLFYRLGLMQQLTHTIETILEHLPDDDRAGRLCNLLGYIHRLGGHLGHAKACHDRAKTIGLTQNLPQLQLSSLLHLGFVERDRWELVSAQAVFEEVLALAAKIDSTQYVIYARCCLAYSCANLGDREGAKALLQQINQITLRRDVTGWGAGYSLLFLAHTYRHLGAWDAALELFHETLHHATDQQFAQIRGKALNGLAQIHRNLGDLPQALTYHNRSIEMLEPLGAKCIFAEALTQRAVTYRALGDLPESKCDFDRATELFQSIHTPNRLVWMRQQFA
jgi:tetratricopeptide (TPR) repeat protein